MSEANNPELEPRDTERLRQELKALFVPPVEAPPADSARVLSLAAQRRLTRLKWRVRVRAASLAAAGIICGISLSFFYVRFRDYQKPPLPALGTLSINYGGRGDILEALALARYVDARGPYRADWDLNRNGSMDQGDVTLLASTIVRAGGAPDVRYYPVDVYIDTDGRPLAAYQLAVDDATGRTRIVGVQGGAEGAFQDPPFYDAAALTRGEVVLAAVSTSKALPRGKVRVARLYVQSIGGPSAPVVRLIAAGSEDGHSISAMPIVVPVENPQ